MGFIFFLLYEVINKNIPFRNCLKKNKRMLAQSGQAFFKKVHPDFTYGC